MENESIFESEESSDDTNNGLNEIPFNLSDIEDVRIIIKAKGKNWGITPRYSADKEDTKHLRTMLAVIALEKHDIVTPSLEDIRVEKLKFKL